MTSISAHHDEPPVRLAYAPALDGLRAVAVLAVMSFHADLPFASGGFLGVDVFFVLSGYLITTLLAAEHAATGRVALGRFYMRRALRLFPALLVLVAVLEVWSWRSVLFGQLAEVHREIVTTLLYVANWAQAARVVEPLGFLSHTWSLAIEEQFYIVWPLVLGWMLSSVSRTTALALTAGGAAVSALLRAAMWTGPDSFARVFHGSDTRAEALLVGCFLALWLGARSTAACRGAATRAMAAVSVVAAIVLGLLFVAASTQVAWMYRGGFSAAAVASMLIVLDLRTRPRSAPARALSAGPLVAIGRISYGLYLWHWPLFLVLSPQFTGLSPAATAAARFAATFAVAGTSWVLVERPILGWKRRWS